MIVLFIFNAPLYKTIEKLPDLVSNSNAITLGNFSLKVDKKLGSKITPEIRDILQMLDGQELVAIITNNMDTASNNIPPVWSYSVMKDVSWGDQIGMQSPLMLSLSKKGIFTQPTFEKIDFDSQQQHVIFKTTQEGIKVRQFLIDLMHELKQSI